jgi:hypothetical protein
MPSDVQIKMSFDRVQIRQLQTTAQHLCMMLPIMSESLAASATALAAEMMDEADMRLHAPEKVVTYNTPETTTAPPRPEKKAGK